MPSIFAILIISLVLFFLSVNVYLRIVIIKQYKGLRDKGLYLDSSVIFNKKKRSTYIAEHHPNNVEELEKFSNNLDKLIKYVIVGFLLILSCFLYSYINGLG